MSDILLHFQHTEDTCGSLKHEELSSKNEEGGNMLPDGFRTFLWLWKDRGSSFFPNDRRSNTNSMLFLFALVYDHLVSVVGWYASCLYLNLSSNGRLSDKILSFKRRSHYRVPSLVLFRYPVFNSKLWFRPRMVKCHLN